MKRIICKNENNVEVEFNQESNADFFLLSLDGAYSISNNVSVTNNTMTDGSTYQGSTVEQRNLVITAFMDCDYQFKRNLLYKCFKPKSTGSFTYIEEQEIRTIDYKVESVEIEDTGVVRNITISLLCPDPFFRDLEDIQVVMAGWKKTFEWPHEFVEEREAFGERIQEVIKNLENESAADHVGMEIRIGVDGEVVNPIIYHIEEREYIRIGTKDHPLHLNAGDVLRITTETNKKNVYLLRDGKETKVNEYMDEESEFIQLVHGSNTLKYDAESGIEYMNVLVAYKFCYLGV